ncbi:hypothetical protein MNBD_DELTA02-1047 [hydrothermal vent metagenome]|uniref:Uncharacterized protein n=1 Tax=hydrothermal vent metagenome TaxID=652676 RepID=A0A3B0VAS3_9ZZZZ
MKVNKKVHQVVSPEASLELRLCAASGEAELAPPDMLTAVILLTRDADPEIKKTATATLKNFPPMELLAALEEKLDPAILKTVTRVYKKNPAVLARIITNPGTGNETLATIAKSASAFLTELISEQTERLCASKEIALALAANPETSDDLLLRIKEFTGSDYDDYGEIEECENENLYQMVTRMTVAEKMKLALKGNNEARGLLIKDSNRIVSSSVLKNPKITDEEIIRLTASTSATDDLLRQVAREKEWMKSMQIKQNLVTNPKTPLAISIKLIKSLDKNTLEKIAKSKNIPHSLASEARKILILKKKHG